VTRYKELLRASVINEQLYRTVQNMNSFILTLTSILLIHQVEKILILVIQTRT
jgi:hypothetical protein